MKLKSPVFLKIIVSLLFVILLPLTGGAQVTAKLERQIIGIDETVRLIIEADGARNTISSINTETLEKDFSILNRSSSSNFRIINGSAKASKVWTLVLEAKRTGTFTIPPFAIGKEKSNSLTLKVTDSTPETSSNNQKSRDVFLEVTPLIETPAYLQGQITVSVKLFLKSQLRITDASLEDPEIEHTIIKKLGKDLNYQTKRGGQSYQVIERKYAIIAEDGDKITIPPLHFQAIRLQGGSRRFAGDPFFGHFSEQRKIRVKSQPLTIALTPIPDEFNGKLWLPALAMDIMDNKDEVKELKIGEPLTRTIQIEALGLTAEQLPEIEVTAPEGSKIYLDQPELQTIVDNNALLHAVKRQSLAFIPSQTGTFTLPAITIKWWDVVNLKQRLATLPEKKIRVVNAKTGEVATPPADNPTIAANDPTKTGHEANISAPSADGNPKPVTEVANTTKIWQTVSAILLLVWVITILLWYRYSRRLSYNGEKQKKAATQQPAANRETIKRACLDRNPQSAQQAILDWAISTWPQEATTNLKTIAHKFNNPELNEVFTDLEKALYSPDDTLIWDGEKAWQKLSVALKPGPHPGRTSSQPGKDALPPLYR